MPKKPYPAWLVLAIADGITLLIALRLKGAPFAGNESDVMAVCEAWMHTIVNINIMWNEEVDKFRIKKGFNVLCSRATVWPSPSQLIECMPKRESPKIIHHKDMSSETLRIGNLEIQKMRKIIKDNSVKK